MRVGMCTAKTEPVQSAAIFAFVACLRMVGTGFLTTTGLRHAANVDLGAGDCARTFILLSSREAVGNTASTDHGPTVVDCSSRDA